MSYLIVDFGTSSCRACLVEEDGTISREVREPVRPDVAGARAEFDPDRAWEILRTAATRLLRTGDAGAGDIPVSPITAVGISSMMGFVFLDARLNPAGPAILYMDNRASKETADFAALLPGNELYRRTGRRASAELLAPKIRWFRTHEPGRLDGVRHVLSLKDYLVYRLTGELAADFAHHNYTLLYDIGSAVLDVELCRAAGADPAWFPKPVSASAVAGRVRRWGAGETGIPEGTPVVCGSIDGTTAMYGCGLLQPGAAAFVSGTTEVLMMMSPRFLPGASTALSQNTGMAPETFAIGGAMGLAGGAYNKYREFFGFNFEEAAAAIETVPLGSEGLLVFSGLTGERAPYWNEKIRGGMAGFGLGHTPAHFLRALFEGTSYRVRRVLALLGETGLKPERLQIAGGGAALDAANQIRADVTGVECVRLKQGEATVLGTSMYCAVGTGRFATLKQAADSWIRPDKVYVPDPKKTQAYGEYAERFDECMAKKG
jgi:sugar (pentulose or hexulose) kinase